MELRLILINLLVKLGLAAALAAALVRSVEFKALLYREQRLLRDRVYLVFWLVISEWIGKALAAGVWKFGATPSPIVGDLSLETAILLGALAGRFAGIIGGALLALPAVFTGAWLTLPLYVVIGFVSGQLREFAPNHEEIWKFSPFNYLSLLRWIRRAEPRPR
ncbi:MAG: sensor histidine kinase, partial [Acidobacteria bacterium]